MTGQGPSRFGWIIPGQLAGSGRPGRHAPIEVDLAFLHEEGIEVIVSLIESTLNLNEYLEEGFEPHHFPVDDFSAPTLEQIREACLVIEASLAQEKKVLVHCNAGIGRTGALLACFLVHRGAQPDEAVRRIRAERPLSLETNEQVEIVNLYYQCRESPP